MWICESGVPVEVHADEFPARCGAAEEAGRPHAAAASADYVEVDDGVIAVVGELREGKAEDVMNMGGIPGRRHVGEDRVCLTAGDTNGPGKGVLVPQMVKIRMINFLCQFVQDADGYGFEKTFGQFVVVIFDKATRVGTCYKEIVRADTVGRKGERDVDKSFR